MKIIAGLGNPGRRYEKTRHNLGFLVLDALAQRWRVALNAYEKRFEAILGEAQRDGDRVLMLKPQTFMNLSGRSVAAAVRYYKLEVSDLLVIYDELDLPLGRLRVRASGSAGGHKGMDDVIRHVGVADIPRIRVGIGKVHSSVTVDHVLSTFDAHERNDVEHAIADAADAAECWISQGIVETMNRFNRKDGGAAGPKGEPS